MVSPRDEESARPPVGAPRRSGGRARGRIESRLTALTIILFALSSVFGETVIMWRQVVLGGGPTDTSGALVEPSASPTSSPDPSDPRPTATADPTVRPTPAPRPPAQPGDYLLMSRSALLARPTRGSAWASLEAVADGSLGSPNLCDQGNKHGVQTLAGALVYARTGTIAYRNKARSAILSAIGTEGTGCGSAILSLGRQLGAYVLAADFIDLDGADDASFRNWLSAIRTRDLGGHSRWYTLAGTSENSANNWGTFALASRVAASAYLGDSTDLARSWQVFSGYSSGAWEFQKTADWSASWSCLPGDGSTRLPIAINGECTRDGIDLDGAPVEDASRGTFPTADGGYVNEAMQGYVVQALLLERSGHAAFEAGGQALRRVAEFQVRNGIWNYHSTGYYVGPVINWAYGTSLPVLPSGFGRVFGYTDWLYGSG